ncbi:MAG: hypothetical protein QM765_17245 [Myxococcales bacterium]
MSDVPSPAPAARCAAHPEREASEVCARCGAFLCPECRKWFSERPVCAPCRRWYEAEGPSREALLSLILVTAGFCLLVPGIAGLVLAHRELARARRGESTESSRSYASLARTLGWCEAALLVFVVVALVWQS